MAFYSCIDDEVFPCDDLMTSKTEQTVMAAGQLRSKGKEHMMKDGNIMLLRFNV